MHSLNVVCAAAMLALIGACGSAPSGSLPSPSPTPSDSAPSPSPSPHPPLAQGMVAECPQAIDNQSGRYALICPQGWKVIDCPQTEFHSPYSWLINPAEQCRQQMSGVRAYVISLDGDQPPASYLGAEQSSRQVTVDSVTGTRTVHLVSANNTMPPPRDTVQVLYRFSTGGRTFYVQYDRYPGDLDRTADFDRMVTETMKFHD
jgi:hypothetical protein